MAKHRDTETYWKDVAPRLGALIAKQRNRAVEDLLTHSLALYSFVQEDFSATAEKHNDVLGHIAVMFVHVQDVLRALAPAQAQLSPVALAALARISLEARCNLLFIVTNREPLKYADRFSRYAGIERLLREEYAPAGTPRLLSDVEEAAIRANCSDWLKANGKVAVKHWTAEERFKSLKALAGDVGLADDYATLYAIGSKFIHGSSLLSNLYATKDGVGVLANPGLCARLSLLATKQCLDFMRAAAAFFEVPAFEDDYLDWLAHWQHCFNQLEGGAA